MTDIFHEVEEDIRHERYAALWKKYGNIVIAVAISIVLSVAGYRAWQVYDLNRREDFSQRFEAAHQLAAAGDMAQAEAAYAVLVADAPGGYAPLVKLHQASVMREQGREDDALATLREVVNDADPLLSASTRMRIAWMQVDSAPRAEIAALLAPLSGPDSPWRLAAAEVLAYKELQSGNHAQAIVQYESLAADPATSENLRQRASAIAQHLRANPTVGGVLAQEPAETANPPPPPAEDTQ